MDSISIDTEPGQKFTVLICVYAGDNACAFRRALASVYNNTLRPAAVVLVVDGPVGKATNNVISDYQEFDSFTVLRCDNNIGFPQALNCGLAAITTEWVVRADPDDVNLPCRFSELAKHMVDGVDIVGSFVAEMNEQGEIYAVKKVPLQHGDILEYIRRRNPFNHMTVAYRGSLAALSGGYPNIPVREDYGLWATMLKHGARCKNIDAVLVHASAGERLYVRRRGWGSVVAEYRLQKHLLHSGVTTLWMALCYGALRAIILSMPSPAVAMIYKVFLRK